MIRLPPHCQQLIVRRTLARRRDIRYHRSNPVKHKPKETPTTENSSNPLVWYAHKLETHPLTTKCITSSFIAGGGDLVCQYVIHNQKKNNPNGRTINRGFDPDVKRTGRFAFMGLCFVGPMYHTWLAFLTRSVGGNTMNAAVKKVVLDQVIFTPFMIPGFMTIIAMLEGKSWETEIKVALVQDVPDAYITNLGIWIPAQLVNFRYVPGKWQVLVSNCVGFVWNSYLSWKTQEN